MPNQQLSIQQIKAAANEYAIKKRGKNVDDRMMTLAISSDGKQRVFGMSGGFDPNDGEVDPTAPYAQYLETYRAKAPWLALPSPGPVKRRPYYFCSEAHVWLELMGRNLNPKHFTVVSFNKLGIIAAPCANCALWVEKTFGALYKETTNYEAHPQQRP